MGTHVHIPRLRVHIDMGYPRTFPTWTLSVVAGRPACTRRFLFVLDIFVALDSDQLPSPLLSIQMHHHWQSDSVEQRNGDVAMAALRRAQHYCGHSYGGCCRAAGA